MEDLKGLMATLAALTFIAMIYSFADGYPRLAMVQAWLVLFFSWLGIIFKSRQDKNNERKKK